MDFEKAFNHLKNDKIMFFLISKFKKDITLTEMTLKLLMMTELQTAGINGQKKFT